jgi:hypothetical protein
VPFRLVGHRRRQRDRQPEVAEVPGDGPGLLRWLAQLGGFLNRKGDGEPGVKTLWRGLRRLGDLTDMYVIMRRRD